MRIDRTFTPDRAVKVSDLVPAAVSSGSMPEILIVEDEDTIREVVRRYLELEGFTVREVADGYSALDAIAQRKPDLIVMDLMLPGIDGLTLTRQIRQAEQIPILILTARGETSDKVRGLDWGADDYLSKPFSPRELVSRVHAILRRVAGITAEVVSFGEVEIDGRRRKVVVRGVETRFTTREFDLLWFMATHPGQVFSREQLLDAVWGADFEGDESTVTVHMRYVRKKVEEAPSEPRYLITVWGVGYRFDA